MSSPILHRAAQFPPPGPQQAAVSRFDGPQVHYRIGPPIDWVGVIAKGVIVAGLGVSVALWVVR